MHLHVIWFFEGQRGQYRLRIARRQESNEEIFVPIVSLIDDEACGVFPAVCGASPVLGLRRFLGQRRATT
jgi:hypothetical protein